MSARDPDSSYFLTRHHANLMQGLAQTSASPGSLSVLHGAAGIGKSRLLEAFIEFHLRDRTWRWIEFLPQGLFLLKGGGQDRPPRPQHELGETLAREEAAELWLVDGFELALDHGREQLYRAWSGQSPRPALVLAGQLSWPEEWRSRLPAHDGALHEAGLKPLDRRESEAYLSNRLCPRPGTELHIDRSLRRALDASRGRVIELEELAARCTSPVCRPLEVNAAFRGKALFWGVFAVLSMILLLWLGAMNRETGDEPHADPASKVTETLPIPVDRTGPAPLGQDADAAMQATTAAESGPAESLPAPAPAAAGNDANGDSSDMVIPPQPAEPPSARPEPPETNPGKPSDADLWTLPFALDPLDERLQATREWLGSATATGYRIQLMTVGGSETSARALNDHLRTLASRGIPLQRLWVYHARDARRPEGYYGLLYGHYADRDQAARARERLPKALRVKRPLLRSLEGLRRETGLGPAS